VSTVFAVLGAGMQGTACAYDLGLFGDPKAVLMADINLAQAERNSVRVNRLLGSDACTPTKVDALDPAALRSFLKSVDVVLSCLPYWMHPQVAAAAVETRTSMVDMGGNTDVTRETLRAAEGAAAAGVSMVPDTGLAPGMVNNFATYLMEQMDETTDVKLYCGGLPQDPKPPFNYKLVFNIEGLVNEYTGKAAVLRDGEPTYVDTLEELETVEHPKLGRLEAFMTSGGTSTAPFTFKGKVRSYVYKTLRYPGHCEKMKLFKELGFWRDDEIETRRGTVVPRELFYALMQSALEAPGKDLVVTRSWAKGTKDGKPVERQIDIVDYYDDKTGFSAMERMTGFSTSIYAIEIAKGNVRPGAIAYELAVPGGRYMEELRRRDFDIEES
jgi:lysine 6-dehydrogenase